MKKIILDTNFLLIPYIFKVDIFSEIDRVSSFKYDICIINRTIDELERIAEKQKGKNKEAAKFALKLIKQKSLKRIGKIQDTRDVDDIILDLDKTNLIVATQDKALKKRLRQNKILVIVLRQKKYLMIVGM